MEEVRPVLQKFDDVFRREWETKTLYLFRTVKILIQRPNSATF